MSYRKGHVHQEENCNLIRLIFGLGRFRCIGKRLVVALKKVIAYSNLLTASLS